jgi:hypothetical protein
VLRDEDGPVLASAMDGQLERQLAEAEVLSAIYDAEFALDMASHAAVEAAVEAQQAADDSLTFRIQVTALGVLHFTLPAGYPAHAAALCSVVVADSLGLGHAERVSLTDGVQLLADELVGEEACMQLCEHAREMVGALEREQDGRTQAIADRAAAEQAEAARRRAERQAAEAVVRAREEEQAREMAARTRPVLGRRLLYSHHIIADSKRKVVQQWAADLGLGGFAKIGWPGIIVVEGGEGACQEYVTRLQHLRWKHLVVRGEETQEGPPGGALDAMRALPQAFEELAESQMSELAQRCRGAGLEALFLTSMKIYQKAEGKVKLQVVYCG